MDQACAGVAERPIENDGHSRPQAKTADKIVRRKFGEVAKVLWDKPDVQIAIIAKCDARTGRRILSGRADVPLEVMLAAVAEMLRPID